MISKHAVLNGNTLITYCNFLDDNEFDIDKNFLETSQVEEFSGEVAFA